MCMRCRWDPNRQLATAAPVCPAGPAHPPAPHTAPRQRPTPDPRDWRQVLTLVNRHGDELTDAQAAAALQRVAALLQRAPLAPFEVGT